MRVAAWIERVCRESVCTAAGPRHHSEEPAAAMARRVGRVSTTAVSTRTILDPFLKRAVSRLSNLVKRFPSASLSELRNGTLAFLIVVLYRARYETEQSRIGTKAADPRRWWTLAVLCLSLLVIGLDNTILNVALPTMQRDLDASSSQLQWIVDVYMLVFAGVLLTAGSLGDRFGRKRALLARPARLRPRLARFSARRLPRAADRHARPDGHRRRADHAVDALDPDRDVPRERARQGDRDLVRRVRHRDRDRPGRRRLADRARRAGAGSSS